MSGRLRTRRVSLWCAVVVLGIPATAHASHPKPGSEVPWVLLLVAAVVVFAAAWVLTVFFERRSR